MASTLFVAAAAAGTTASEWKAELFQTTRSGDTLRYMGALESVEASAGAMELYPEQTYQTLEGIGGAFTESAADALASLSEEKRKEVLDAYFSPEGAAFSLMRTHVASCDFSLSNYTYAPDPGDVDLESFTIDRDRELLLPLIKDAQLVEGARFKISASPWTAPPWMKDNGTWNGGKLLPEYYDVFSNYLVKYLQAYEQEGVPIWALTPINEPEGNGENWESMIFNPEEMSNYISQSLGPVLRKENLDTKVYIFDQNRDHMREWAKVIYGDAEAAQYLEGMAVHWYSSTVSPCEDELDAVHEMYPEKSIIHSEGCIDALGDDEPIGSWLEPDWWWRAEASDWGWIWAPEELKKDHPKYVPVYRYARDLIGGINHWMSGWIDWNIVLDFRGGPNHAENYCGAPVMVDRESGEIFYTPVFYAISHFSRFMRPEAKRIGFSNTPEGLQATAVVNEDGSLVVVCLNEGSESLSFNLKVGDFCVKVETPGESIQTVTLRR